MPQWRLSLQNALVDPMISSSRGDRGGSKLIGRNSIGYSTIFARGGAMLLRPTDLTAGGQKGVARVSTATRVLLPNSPNAAGLHGRYAGPKYNTKSRVSLRSRGLCSL
jgi:hypothetical protein